MSGSIDWQRSAACHGMDGEVFFPASERVPTSDEVTRARIVCWRCPVRPECLAWAVNNLPDGIAGGHTAAERRALRKQQLQKASA